MGMSMERALQIADEVKARCNGIVAEYLKCKALLASNSNEAIDWGAAQLPEYLTEDVNGNLTGRKFSRQEVSNAIGSIDAFRAFAEANNSAHIGNLNQLADPCPIR